MPIPARIKNHLDENHVPYLPLAHPSSYTSQGAAAVMHVSGRAVAKTVVVQVAKEYLLVVMPASYHVNADKLSSAIGLPARLTTEVEFSSSFPDCELGAIPPLGELYSLRVFVDESLAVDKEIILNAGTHTDGKENGVFTFFGHPYRVVLCWTSPLN